jgi:hypothetical protein
MNFKQILHRIGLVMFLTCVGNVQGINNGDEADLEKRLIAEAQDTWFEN